MITKRVTPKRYEIHVVIEKTKEVVKLGELISPSFLEACNTFFKYDESYDSRTLTANVGQIVDLSATKN